MEVKNEWPVAKYKILIRFDEYRVLFVLLQVFIHNPIQSSAN